MARNNRRTPRSYVSDAEDSELDYCRECGEVIVPGGTCPCCQDPPENLRRTLRPAA